MTKWAIEEKRRGEHWFSVTAQFHFLSLVPCEEMRVQSCGGKATRHGSASQEHICALNRLCLSSREGLGTHQAFGHISEVKHKGTNQTDWFLISIKSQQQPGLEASCFSFCGLPGKVGLDKVNKQCSPFPKQLPSWCCSPVLVFIPDTLLFLCWK